VQAGLVFLLTCGLFIGRCDGTAGKAPVRVPVGANVPSTVAARRGTLEDRFVHGEDCTRTTLSIIEGAACVCVYHIQQIATNALG
jgi:hypothetical protein